MLPYLQIVHHPDQPAACFEGLPCVVVMPSGTSRLVLECRPIPPDQSLRASFQSATTPVSVSPAESTATGQHRLKLEVTLPLSTYSPGCEHVPSGLLVLEVWSSISHSVVGSCLILVLQPGKEAVAEELVAAVGPDVVGLQGTGCKSSTTAAPGPVPGPCDRELVATLGWWLEVVERGRIRASTAASEAPMGPGPLASSMGVGVGSQQATLQLLQHVGTRVLRLLVNQGRPAAARMVLAQLMAPACGGLRLEDISSGAGHPLSRSLL
jgi:hypothetical protein